MDNLPAKQSSLDVFRSLDLTRPQDLAAVFVKSGFFQDTRDMSQACVKILAGREIGIPPITSMMGIDVIKGKLRLSANILASMVKTSGTVDYRVREWTEDVCRIEFLQREEPGRPWESLGFGSFTMAEAEAAGLTRGGSGWQKFRRAMLFARAMSNGVAAHCPHVTKGVRTYTEGDDFGAADRGYAARVPESEKIRFDDLVPMDEHGPLEPPPPEPHPEDDVPPDLFDAKPEPPPLATPPGAAPVTEPQLRKIGALRSKVYPDDETYHEALWAAHGVDTTKALTKAQASQWIEHMVKLEEER